MGADDKLIEAMARAIFLHWQFQADAADDVPWVTGGNSLKQDEARAYATAALAAYRAHQRAAGIVEVPSVATLANIIRTVDGNHSLGAGRLAEEIVRSLIAAAEATDGA